MTPRPRLQDDEGLRAQLRRGLSAASPTDSEALEARVLAQWKQRHAAVDAVAASAGGATLRAPGRGHRARWWATGALLVAALIATATTWQTRDPTVDELMQLDVLSEMALGEM